MGQAMTPDEFAAMVGLPRDKVERYQSLGLLDPEGDGLLDDVDFVRLDFVGHRLPQYGNSAENVAAAIRDGRVESMFGRRLFEASTPIAVDEAAMRAGIDPDQLRQLMSTLGFSEPYLQDSHVDLFEILRVTREAGLPWEAVVGLTRVVGDSLRRIAESEIRAVHVYIHERLLAAGRTQDEVTQLISGIEENVAPLMAPLLEWLHREYLLEAMIEDFFFHLADPTVLFHLVGSEAQSKDGCSVGVGSEAPSRDLGSVDATIVFVDVASFTELAESRGDDAAVQVLDRVDAVIRAILVEHDGKLVKQIGDGFMLAFRDAAAAVRFAVATQAELARDPDLPAIRVGINSGAALNRMGDYLGNAVNVASRVVNAAMAGQILLTEPVAVAARDSGIDVDEVGVRMMRGVDDPLALYRVRPAIARTAAAAG